MLVMSAMLVAGFAGYAPSLHRTDAHPALAARSAAPLLAASEGSALSEAKVDKYARLASTPRASLALISSSDATHNVAPQAGQ
jgi:hypothetical protein